MSVTMAGYNRPSQINMSCKNTHYLL